MSTEVLRETTNNFELATSKFDEREINDEKNCFENEFDEDDSYENGMESFDFNSSTMSSEMKKKRVLTKSQRVAANHRERKRMNIMNDSFVKLRQALPISTGRKRRKMSRLDIVVGAMEYISYLDSLLESGEPCEIDFEAYQTKLYMEYL